MTIFSKRVESRESIDAALKEKVSSNLLETCCLIAHPVSKLVNIHSIKHPSNESGESAVVDVDVDEVRVPNTGENEEKAFIFGYSDGFNGFEENLDSSFAVCRIEIRIFDRFEIGQQSKTEDGLFLFLVVAFNVVFLETWNGVFEVLF